MATFTATPPRTLIQRMEALTKANDTRTRRAVLKRDLKAGRKQLIPMLLNPPAYIETMKVCDLVLACPKYGRVKVNRILSRARVSPSKAVGGLSDRQRREVALLVSGRVGEAGS